MPYKKTPLQPLRLSKGPSLLAVSILFIFFVCLTTIGVSILQLLQSYNNELSQTENSTANLARSMAQQAQDTFDEANIALSGIVDTVQKYGSSSSELISLHETLVKRVKLIPQLQGIYVFDENGNWIVTSFDLATDKFTSIDREYYQYHSDHDGEDAHVGPAIKSRATGEWIVPLSRRISGSDGKFKGVVVAAIKMSYFDKFFEGFNIDEQGAMLVTSTDGVILARRPFKEDLIGENIKHGNLFKAIAASTNKNAVTITSIVDGVTRIFGFEQLARYPIIVAGGASKESALHDWKANALQSTYIIAATTLLNCILGWLLIFHVKKGQKTESALREAHAALQISATHDALTGLANRRLFEDRLNSEFKRGTRSNFPLSLLMIDIDFFKSFNDEYGHVEGDHCIAEVAAAVEYSLKRDSDLAVRYGGEEIAVILPHTDCDGAFKVAETIRISVLERAIPHNGNPTGVVSISLGVYTCLPTSKCNVDEFVGLADSALYEAKKTGRNKTVVQYKG